METLIKNTNNLPIKSGYYIMAGDFETIFIEDKQYPVCLGLAYYFVDVDNCIVKHSYEHFLLEESEKQNLKDNYYLLFYKMLKFLTLLNQKEVYIFFHNGSSLDFTLILSSLERIMVVENKKYLLNNFIYKNPTIFSFTLHLNDRCKVVFRDSFTLIPFSLSKAGMLFEADVKKGEYDYDKLEFNNFVSTYDSEFWSELLFYMKQDCLTLLHLLNKYIDLLKEYNCDITTKNSVSSIALSIFRNEDNNFYNYHKTPLHKLTSNIDEFIRKSYFGGATEIYKPLGFDIKVYDVNSMYPAAMIDNDMPIGKPKFTKEVDLDNFFGFVLCKCEVPSDLYRPVLPFKKGGVVIYPTGEFEGVYFSEELKYAQSKGYKITPKCGYTFERGRPFTTFMEYFYNKRIEDKNNRTKSTFYKLVMNSLYGRMGLKKEISEMAIVDRYNFDKISTVFKVEDYSEFGDEVIIKYNKEIDKDRLSVLERYYDVDEVKKLVRRVDVLLDNQMSAVQIASAVTSYSRMKILEFSEKYDSLYIDTDAIYTNKRIEGSNKLGELKFEGEYKTTIFLSSKCYLLYNHEEDYKLTFKGLKTPYKRFKKEEILEIFLDKLKEEHEKLSFEEVRKFVKCFKELSIKKQIITKTYSLLTNKRYKVYKEGKWCDTKPLETEIEEK